MALIPIDPSSRHQSLDNHQHRFKDRDNNADDLFLLLPAVNPFVIRYDDEV